MSPLAVIRFLPSGENATLRTVPVCPLNKRDESEGMSTNSTPCPVANAYWFPLGEKATACPEYALWTGSRTSPLLRSQSWAGNEVIPVTKYRPSEEKAAAITPFELPRKIISSAPVATSQSRAQPSKPPLNALLPSGENATPAVPSACPLKL